MKVLLFVYKQINIFRCLPSLLITVIKWYRFFFTNLLIFALILSVRRLKICFLLYASYILAIIRSAL